jgi:hypothetical protein
MTGIIGLAWVCAALAQPPGPSPAPLHAPRENLARIVRQFDFTEKGSSRWLSALGVLPGAAGRERLLVMSASGTLVATKGGSEFVVLFGPEIELRLMTPGANHVLVHNHPDNAGLSANDLAQLSKPGVAAVVAVAHDRSLYIAVRGSRYDGELFLDRQYDVVRSEILKWLRIDAGAGMVRPRAGNAHFSHLAALALAKAGVIEYRAVLLASARESFDSARVGFGHVVVASAAALGSLPRSAAIRPTSR